MPVIEVDRNGLARLGAALREAPGHLIVDVSTSSLHDFVDAVSRDPGLISCFDLVVVPVRAGYYFEQKAVDTVRWLRGQAVNPLVIRFFYNHVDMLRQNPMTGVLEDNTDLSDQLPVLTRFSESIPALGKQTYDCQLATVPFLDLDCMGDATATPAEVEPSRPLV